MQDMKLVLMAVAPRGKPEVINGFASAYGECCARAELNTKLRQAHFIAQCAHESDSFKTTVEYASGKAYEGRRDLGNVQPGDGVRYKGRGVIQLTGRANYRTYGHSLGIDLEGNPTQAAQFPYAALTAAEYWRWKNINVKADRNDLDAVTRAVNGGTNGLASRKTYLDRALHALSDVKGALVKRSDELTASAKSKGKVAGGVGAGAGGSGVTAATDQPHAPGWLLAAVCVSLLAIAAFIAWKAYQDRVQAKAFRDAAGE